MKFSQLKPNTSTIGALIRAARQQRRLSQMDLALDAGISPRHLSFLETGRSRPSVDVLLALAESLSQPLRMRNKWLLAAGYAPRYTEEPLASPHMSHIHAALSKLLQAHDPYPGVVLDSQWNIVKANATAQRLLSLLPNSLREPQVNMFRASLSPDGFAAFTENFEEWGAYLMQTLRKQAQNSGDPIVAALLEEVLQYPGVAVLEKGISDPPGNAPALLIPCVLILGGQRYSLFTTMTSFGTPRDITLAELSIELFYPSDPATDALLHAHPQTI